MRLTFVARLTLILTLERVPTEISSFLDTCKDELKTSFFTTWLEKVSFEDLSEISTKDETKRVGIFKATLTTSGEKMCSKKDFSSTMRVKIKAFRTFWSSKNAFIFAPV